VSGVKGRPGAKAPRPALLSPFRKEKGVWAETRSNRSSKQFWWNDRYEERSSVRFANAMTANASS
jgi:hypothetical protein